MSDTQKENVLIVRVQTLSVSADTVILKPWLTDIILPSMKYRLSENIAKVRFYWLSKPTIQCALGPRCDYLTLQVSFKAFKGPKKRCSRHILPFHIRNQQSHSIQSFPKALEVALALENHPLDHAGYIHNLLAPHLGSAIFCTKYSVCIIPLGLDHPVWLVLYALR